jgi:hypothetical protein
MDSSEAPAVAEGASTTSTQPKKPFRTPQLRDYGDVRSFTLTGTTNPSADASTGYTDS